METQYDVSMAPIDQLIDQTPDFDGVLFRSFSDEKYEMAWRISYLSFGETEFDETDLGCRHYIMFFNDDGSVDLTEAILTSPSTYLKNLMTSSNDGLIMKKCPESEHVIRKHMLHRAKVALKSYVNVKRLTEIEKEIEEELANA